MRGAHLTGWLLGALVLAIALACVGAYCTFGRWPE
jgi:hypothetical protein